MAFIYIFTDRWLLQYYSGSVEQAYYSVAAQFAAIALIFTTSILRIFWKEISEAQEKGNNEVVNTAGDMIEWIDWDVEEGKVDSAIAETYVINLKEIINTVNCENCDEID